jgi:hypothetical protein
MTGLGEAAGKSPGIDSPVMPKALQARRPGMSGNRAGLVPSRGSSLECSHGKAVPSRMARGGLREERRRVRGEATPAKAGMGPGGERSLRRAVLTICLNPRPSLRPSRSCLQAWLAVTVRTNGSQSCLRRLAGECGTTRRIKQILLSCLGDRL